MALYDAQERLCIQTLAVMYEKGDPLILPGGIVSDAGPLRDRQQMDLPTFERVMRTLKGQGLVDDVQEVPFFGSAFTVTDACVQQERELVREENEAKRQDILEQVKTMIRSRPYTAWPISFSLG